MIEHIKGRLIEKTPTYAIIETGGIGYYVNTSLNTYSKIPDKEACSLYIHFSVREDAQTLYGFYEKEERDLFRNLISASGIGPSTAQVLLSSLSPDEAVQAILSADVATIQKVKGIGSKTAQRIILDLKDKISKGSLGATEGINALNSSNKSHQDALSALLMLGFGKAATEKVLDKVVKDSGQDISVEQLIKAALQRL